jgi:hypothetical protein
MESRIKGKGAKRTGCIGIKGMDSLGNAKFGRNNIPNHFSQE